MKKLFLDTLAGKDVSETPIWIMRQAGRYLPEYRRIRSNFSDFMEMCHNAEACCEVALQPLIRYNLDASIVFSDILTVPQAMGMKLKFVRDQGPIFSAPLSNLSDIKNLDDKYAIENLQYVMKAITLTKKEVKVPLIGFSGSPWTLAAYMIEGKGSKNFTALRKMLYSAPSQLHILLSKLSYVIANYLDQQIKSGVDALMIFDTWGGVLSESTYIPFSLHYMECIVQELKKHHTQVPIILFTKGGSLWLDKLIKTNCDSIGIDWSIDILRARKIVGSEITLQGNLDPAVLYGSNENIIQHVKYIAQSQSSYSRFIFNLGHGVYPDIEPEKVQVMVDALREFGIKKDYT